MWYIVIILVLLIILYIWYKSKQLKLPNVYLITGGVKTGKSALSVCLAIKQYKRNLRQYHIKKFFCSIFKKAKPERPVLFSNMHLRNIEYSLLTRAILERTERIPYKSVVLIDEVALMADSMSIKDSLMNEKLLLFVKLFGHSTRGGTLILNTQSLLDCHYAFKRGLQNYLWIHSRKKYPLITRFKVREMIFSNENSSANEFNEDIEKSTLNLWALNKYYKYYDCYCYSVFTDNLKIYCEPQKRYKRDSLKTDVIISFKQYQTLLDFYQKNQEKQLEVSSPEGDDVPINDSINVEI